LIATNKTRWVRKFDTSNDLVTEIELNEDEAPKNDPTTLPEHGCNIELTKVLVEPDLQVWWTFGCEAFGPSLAAVEQNIGLFLDKVLAKNSPSIDGGTEASYAAWMSTMSLFS